jgi:hypothetical protein
MGEILLEEAVESLVSKYSSFSELINDINQFILNKEELFEKVEDNTDKESNLETKTKTTKVKQSKKVENIDDLEDTEEDSDDDEETITITYGINEEEILAKDFYKSSQVDYNKLFATEYKQGEGIEVYESEFSALVSDTHSETMGSAKEAEETFTKMQYAQILGAKSEVDYVTRKKFSNWITFNKALFSLFEANSVTKDINYTEY